MKAALFIVLAGLLVILPVEQVLAQAEQQEAVSVQQTAPSDPAARLFRVPPLTENSARLLGGSSERAPLNTPIVDALLVQENNGGGLALGWNVLIVAVIGAGVVVGMYYLVKAIGDLDFGH